MLARFLQRMIRKHKEFLLAQVLEVQGLMQILMKNRNTASSSCPSCLRSWIGENRSGLGP